MSLGQKDRLISEIITVEKELADKLTSNRHFIDWVSWIREKYIVKEFLSAFYTGDEGQSRLIRRIEKLGSYILTWDRLGELFGDNQHDYVSNEPMWFWFYLAGGREVLSATSEYALPRYISRRNLPSVRLWKETSTLLKKLELSGHLGGGIFETLADLDEDKLATLQEPLKPISVTLEDDIETVDLLPKPRWMSLFERYEALLDRSRSRIQLAPSWFHILNHAFFNHPIAGLPVFCAIYDSAGSLSQLSFQPYLSDEARAFISKICTSLPIELKKLTQDQFLNKLKRNMVWWLWHNIGHAGYKRSISHAEIAHKSGDIKRSTVQSGINALDNKLRNVMDRYLLGDLLRTAEKLRLDVNVVYSHLVTLKLVPERNRPIDGLDFLYELI